STKVNVRRELTQRSFSHRRACEYKRAAVGIAGLQLRHPVHELPMIGPVPIISGGSRVTWISAAINAAAHLQRNTARGTALVLIHISEIIVVTRADISAVGECIRTARCTEADSSSRSMAE